MGITDIYRTRQDNLTRLITARFGGSQAAFAARIGRSPAQVSQWIKGRRNISDDTRDLIEASCGAPGWLDTLPTSPANAISSATVGEIGQAAVVGPSLAQALPVVLEALARAPQRDKLRTALLAVLDDDAPAYRQRLAELLSAAAGNAAPTGLAETHDFAGKPAGPGANAGPPAAPHAQGGASDDRNRTTAARK